MSKKILIRNADAIVTCDDADRVLYHSDILLSGGRIEAVGRDLSAGGAQVIDAAGKYVYPGLVNTHHHFFQAFVRNLMTIDRPGLTLMQWLDDIYKVFVRINGDVIFYASAACMADLIKHGCTCSVDHQYCYTPATGITAVDRQMEAANMMGFRFVAARGTNTLPRWQGSTIPDEMCETTAAYLDDCQRLLALYHDPAPFSMRQIVLAPCQPINCTEDTFTETIRLARSAGVHMHTHLCEGENSSMVRRFGVRSLEWCRRIGFTGSDIWLAHGRETLPEEYPLLAESGMGISHCPAPTMLGGSEILDIPGMRKAGIPLGLGGRLRHQRRLQYAGHPASGVPDADVPQQAAGRLPLALRHAEAGHRRRRRHDRPSGAGPSGCRKGRGPLYGGCPPPGVRRRAPRPRLHAGQAGRHRSCLAHHDQWPRCLSE